MMKQHFWGMTAAFFGAWETLSFASKGKVPTVSRSVWWSLGRSAPLTKLVVAAYLVGLARHLLSAETSR